MESFGEYLKRLREERGKGLDEISQSTKIAITNLEFLEKDRYELLPPRVFVKGFIRSYVEELGLNPEESLRLFDRFTKVGEVPNYEGEEHPVFPREEPSLSFISRPVFTIILTSAGAICLVILLLTAVVRLFTSGEPAKNSQPEVTT
ncbi:MAG: helix-turn-helix domain-containing protein, partial [Thermodesulfobacteriota bacterium]